MSPLLRGTRSSLVSPKRSVVPRTPPVTDQLTAHYAARLESFSDGDAVGTLTDQQNANDLTQSTSSKKPTFRDNATDNIGGHPVVDWDGSDDVLTATNFLDSTSGEIIIVLQTDDVSTSGKRIVSVSDSSVDNRYALSGQNDQINQITNTDGTNDQVDGGTSLSTGTDYMWGWRSSGTSWSLRIDGSDETLAVTNTNDGGWWGDVSNRDKTALGAWMRDSGSGLEALQHFDGRIAEVLLYAKELTSTERSDVEDWLNNNVGYGVF